MKRRYFCSQMSKYGRDELGETQGKIIAAHFNTDGNVWEVLIEYEIDDAV